MAFGVDGEGRTHTVLRQFGGPKVDNAVGGTRQQRGDDFEVLAIGLGGVR